MSNYLSIQQQYIILLFCFFFNSPDWSNTMTNAICFYRLIVATNKTSQICDIGVWWKIAEVGLWAWLGWSCFLPDSRVYCECPLKIVEIFCTTLNGVGLYFSKTVEQVFSCTNIFTFICSMLTKRTLIFVDTWKLKVWLKSFQRWPHFSMEK